MHFALCFALVAIVTAQEQNSRFDFNGGRVFQNTGIVTNEKLPCGFSCSRKTAVLTMVDGVFSRAECSDPNGDVRARCGPCCEMRALSVGLSAQSAAGFLSVTGECVCCFDNKSC